MANITWQSVAAPDFRSSNALLTTGQAQVSQGLGDIGGQVNAFASKQKTDAKDKTIEDMQHSLLSFSTQDGIDEKDILAKGLKIGKDLGLSPTESIAQVGIVSDVYNKSGTLTEDQSLEFEGLTSQVDAAKQQGANYLKNVLTSFDQENPSSYATSLKTQYGEGLSPGQAIEQGTAGFKGSQWFNLMGGETGQDLKIAIADMLKLDDFKNVDGAVVAEAFKRTGVDEGGWFDKDGLNLTFFEENLKTINDRYKQENDNLTLRLVKEQQVSSDIQSKISALEKNATDYYRSTKKSNSTRTFSKY
jgi:hypothetical protein